MDTNTKIGVFLCECGPHIGPKVDLGTLEKIVSHDPLVETCEKLPYACLGPGLSAIRKTVADRGLDRIVVAGCQARLMMKKMERELSDAGLETGQISMVNIKGHVAAVNDLAPDDMAAKGARLISAAAADMASMVPGRRIQVKIDTPVLIMGGGLASFSAAQELSRKGVECILALRREEEAILETMHRHYPGERHNLSRVRAIISEVSKSPLVTRLHVGEPIARNGKTGNYTVSFIRPEGGPPLTVQCGIILACLDGVMREPGPEFGHNGDNVLAQDEADSLIAHQLPKGQVVMWINDHEAGTPEFAHLSIKSAWAMARHILERSKETRVTIFHNRKEPMPLYGEERKLARKLGVKWVSYDSRIRPSVQHEFLTYVTQDDDMERELAWDLLVLSPRRGVGKWARKVSDLINLDHKEGRFLKAYHAPVRPENIGRKETMVAGSAAYPCDLHQALAQGRRAAGKVADTVLEARQGRLFSPAIVSIVDPEKCVGCGQCEELCECGAILAVETIGGGYARQVDPAICTGGGTGAAACPYGAMTLQNSSNIQREAAAEALARSLPDDGILSFGCTWGGFAAADNAGKMGLSVDARLHMLHVSCVGQIDASVMARALAGGANGLVIFGCDPEECHHSFGVDHGFSRVNMIKKLLSLSGFDRNRIVLAHADFNNPESFVKTVKSAANQIASLGPIDRSPDNIQKLKAIYDTTKNPRVRLLLSAVLRRPWENTYQGDQRYALEYDTDFANVLEEELFYERLKRLLKDTEKPLPINEMAKALSEDKDRLSEVLWSMRTEGAVNIIHKNRIAHYTL